jgi:dienelactone hydrolase
MNFLLLLVPLAFSLPANAKIVTKTVEYKDAKGAQLEGYLAYDDRIKNAPGVMIVHEWTGLGSYVKKRAEQVAGLGYVALAVDIYGKGIRPQQPSEAAKVSGIYKADRPLFRERLKAGLAELRKQKNVDPHRVAAIGYCFGGTGVLELARSGADVRAVVSFHGGLDTPSPKDAKNIKASVLVLDGADDPNVPEQQVKGFEKEMREAGVDWVLVKYSKAVHSFTNPDSGNDPSRGVAYNELADKRSWEAMKAFLKETLR